MVLVKFLSAKDGLKAVLIAAMPLITGASGKRIDASSA
jgi:hypothetical protein